MTERRNGKQNAIIQSLTDKCRQSDICIVFLSKNKHNADETKEQYLKRLRNMGYRKQSDTVREFVQKLDKNWVEVTTKEYGTFYAVSEERIQELAEKYGINTEDLCD